MSALPTRLCRCALVAGIALLALTLGGCSSDAGPSGFLSNYTDLEPEKGDESFKVYQSDSLSLGDYDAILIDPVRVHFAPNAKGQTIDPKKVSDVVGFLQDGLQTKVVEGGYRVADAPGPRVARLRVAITDIELGNTVLNAVPTTKLTGAGLGGASFEAELLDSTSSAVVMAAMDSRRGSQFSLKGLGDLDNAKQAIDYWLANFVKRLKAAK